MFLGFIVGFLVGTFIWLTAFYYVLKYYGLLDLVMDTINDDKPRKKGGLTKTGVLLIIIFNIVYTATIVNKWGIF